jgi:hypothetical protein
MCCNPAKGRVEKKEKRKITPRSEPFLRELK